MYKPGDSITVTEDIVDYMIHTNISTVRQMIWGKRSCAVVCLYIKKNMYSFGTENILKFGTYLLSRFNPCWQPD